MLLPAVLWHGECFRVDVLTTTLKTTTKNSDERRGTKIQVQYRSTLFTVESETC